MKTIIAMVIGALLFGGGLIGGLIIQSSLMNNHQATATTYERLAVENYVSKPFTISGIQFNLKNEGSADIQIVNIMINGFPNQSSSSSMIGWNGTTYFYPNQTGLIWVYYPAYAQAIQSTMPSMPSMSSDATLEELEGFESWMNSFNSTFTFITSTEYGYNYTISRLGYDMFTALSLSESFNFMTTEQVKITNIGFTGNGDTITVALQNVGTNPVTVTEVHVNNGGNLLSAQFTIQPNSQYIASVTYLWTNGAQYEIEVRSSKGNQFTYTATAPS